MKFHYLEAVKSVRKIEGELAKYMGKDVEDHMRKQIGRIFEQTRIISDVLEQDFNIERFTKISANFEQLLQLLYDRIALCGIDMGNKLEKLEDELKKITDDIDNIKLLNIVSDVENTIVIIGSNGSGKSSFVSNLKKGTLPNLCVLPAQKYLFFSTETFDREKVTVESYQKILKETNYIELSKTLDSRHRLETTFTYPFSYLITALVKEYSDIATRKLRNEKEFSEKVPIWDDLEKIWNMLIPDITFKINSNDRKIDVFKGNQEYSINGLSDGEKCIIFYIGNVLIAPKNSYIVVDEPETFLNPSIYNKLWDILIQKRSDCQFIFTSHTMEFINARSNCSYVWCKNFMYPSSYEMQILEPQIEFPMTLLTELVGSKKPILFCEGNYNSNDYQIFSKLFLDKYYIKPVGGHRNVINFTKGYNEICALHGNKAVGIIDGDFLNEETEQKYMKENIFVLHYNEIEMFLLHEDVIESVLAPYYSEQEKREKISKYKEAFFKENKDFKQRILLEATKKQVDKYLETNLIRDYSSKEKIQKEIQLLSHRISVDEIYNAHAIILDKAIEEKDYEKLLKLCNLKGQIIGKLGNEFLMENYKEYAIKRISIDEKLQDDLRKKCFGKLTI